MVSGELGVGVGDLRVCCPGEVVEDGHAECGGNANEETQGEEECQSELLTEWELHFFD